LSVIFLEMGDYEKKKKDPGIF